MRTTEIMNAFSVVERRRQAYLAVTAGQAPESEKRMVKDEYLLAMEAALELFRP